ncbi:MAG: kynureninase [bacterium]
MSAHAESSEDFARSLDAQDSLAHFRERFHIPRGADGTPLIYLCGNSLGLMPKAARALVEQELDDWARLAVDAHFDARTPWYSYHEVFREAGARLVGALPGEVVMMNSLTVNLHLMMTSFYRPTRERHKILLEADPFPSDLYAVQSQLRFHGYDPGNALLFAAPRAGERAIRTDDIEALLSERGGEIALVLFGGVHYLTGQLFEMERIARAAHEHGCAVGFDLAHAAGNAPLSLHDWNADFAVWCSYKYLNAGPGAIAGCFVHERHARSVDLPRLAGWWGNDPSTRFEMRTNVEFAPRAGADGWQVSNPPILAMAPLRASLALFDEAGSAPLRNKSVQLTSYLERLLRAIPSDRFEIITPSAHDARGAQLSLRLRDGARRVFDALAARGAIGDFRDPDVIRVAPVPLYNSFDDARRFAQIFAECLEAR